jgi:hypothetical protein
MMAVLITIPIDADVPPNGEISTEVPNLRSGDIDADTGKLTVDGVDWPATFAVGFDRQIVYAYNQATEVIPAGSIVEISWEGYILQDLVEANDARITALENAPPPADGNERALTIVKDIPNNITLSTSVTKIITVDVILPRTGISRLKVSLSLVFNTGSQAMNTTWSVEVTNNINSQVLYLTLRKGQNAYIGSHSEFYLDALGPNIQLDISMKTVPADQTSGLSISGANASPHTSRYSIADEGAVGDSSIIGTRPKKREMSNDARPDPN